MQAKAQELQAKYDEDVGLLRMQIEEMSEAREVCHASPPPTPRPAPLYSGRLLLDFLDMQCRIACVARGHENRGVQVKLQPRQVE